MAKKDEIEVTEVVTTPEPVQEVVRDSFTATTETVGSEVIAEEPRSEKVNDQIFLNADVVKQAEEKKEVEFENMTDKAVRNYLVMNPDVKLEQKIQNFTAEEWAFAAEFDMTPEQLEKYSGKKVGELLAAYKNAQ